VTVSGDGRGSVRGASNSHYHVEDEFTLNIDAREAQNEWPSLSQIVAIPPYRTTAPTKGVEVHMIGPVTIIYIYKNILIY
jgi:hypothetical protein